MPYPWVVFTLDGLWNVFATKRDALHAVQREHHDCRKRPPCRQLVDGSYEYLSPRLRRYDSVKTYWITNRPRVVEHSGVDTAKVAALRDALRYS